MMPRMKRRIFVAIDLPPNLKPQVAEAITQWRWLPIRWLAPESWHITLIPPAYLEDREVGALLALVGPPAGRAGRSRFGKPFPVRFLRVVLAPPGVPARMIWLEGDMPPELTRLKKKLEAAWDSVVGLPRLEPETRPLYLHVTLARFEPGELTELEQKTRVLGDVGLDFKANEILVMESHLKPSGAEYERLAAVPL